MNEAIKLCECGCGKSAPIAKMTKTKCGHIKGMPIRFIYGHYSKTAPKGKLSPNYGKLGLEREKNPRWNGGIRISNERRIFLLLPEHHRSDENGYVLKSILLAEKALGKPLPLKAQVHHFDEDPSNDFCNLILCENQKYHHLLHQRKRAYESCGYANWRKCKYCKKYDDPRNLYVHTFNALSYHRDCKNRYERKKYQLIKHAEEL